MVMGQLVDEIITLLATGDQLLHHLTGGSHHALLESAPGLLETGPTPAASPECYSQPPATLSA